MDDTEKSPTFVHAINDRYNQFVAACGATLALYTLTSVLLKSGGLDMVVLEPTNERAGYMTVKEARRLGLDSTKQSFSLPPEKHVQ